MSNNYRATQEYTGLVRFFHWARALAIFALIATGFYIAYPFLEPRSSVYQNMQLLQAYIRSAHIMAGFVLIAICLFRFYLFFFDRKSSEERLSLKGVFSLSTWLEQLKIYFLVGKHSQKEGLYNPMQFVAYFSLCVLLVLVILSGIVLYYNVYHLGLGGVLERYFKWFEVLCGGLANVRYIHHLTTWAIMLFIPIHVYMVFFHSIKFPDGGADVMVSGRRYIKG
ncbi:Ni/Fe-hydrogenase, b-type cytochrome subunit [Helicobacter cynogastricus]|uniref:Ni/Fe-hydrogenase, b-type cytochrome subunit n=1 Tax=Helicobacter cynogastricus TaxID=329937 RepID=UPI000CF028F0|nr:Ni/Fe-hydrogenase, b-type cytochrome subunit [Helicobacter cynogastricus]